ncbi:MAG TPA: hypothetical protein VL354_09780, partial [Spirochaetia bacterium]|nr:hypothetical protein [Spirochaetia bacterium]
MPGRAPKAADDFEIGLTVFSVMLAIIFLASAYLAVVDLTKGRIITGWIGASVLAIIPVVFLLTWYGRLGRNAGLALVLYICLIGFMAIGATIVVGRRTNVPIANHVVYTLVGMMLFMGGTGFIVNRLSSVVVGAVSIAYLCFLALSLRDEFLSESLPVLVSFIVAYSTFLFFYRGKLESILRKLHDSNANLESQKGELSKLKDEAESAYAVLKRTQDRVIAQEKLASLGALTAGIAHEIKTPLNFMSDFAESSVELLEELKVHVDKSRSTLSSADRDNVDYLVGELTKNMSDIAERGRRSDRI